jgi:hypothetical protein
VKDIFKDSPSAKVYAACAVLLLAASPPFAAWSMGAMEVTCEAFLLVASLFFLSRAIRETASFAVRLTTVGSLFLAANALLRPEGIFIAFFVAMAFIFFSDRKVRIVRIFSLGLPLLLIYGNFLLWRWNEYGDIFPNTYYAKTGGGFLSYALGIKYFLGAYGAVAGPTFFVIPIALRRIKNLREPVALLSALVAAVTVFIIFAGGDWMPAFRFAVPVTPALIVLALIGFKRLAEMLEGRLRKFYYHFVFAGLLVLVASVFGGRVLIRAQVYNMGSTLMSGSGHALPSHVKASAWLREHSAGKHVFACGEAGIIGYENPDLRLIDLNGLMDKHIAAIHKRGEPFDVNYVLDQKPDFILLYGTQQEGRDRFFFRAFEDYFGAISASTRFYNEYKLAERMIAFDIYERK